MWWWVIGVIIIIWIVILFSYVQLTTYLMRKGKDDLLQLDVKAIFGLVRFKIEVPVIIFKGLNEGLDYKAEAVLTNLKNPVGNYNEALDQPKIKGHFQKARELYNHVDNFPSWMNNILSHLQCVKLRWYTNLGIGDCASTAMLSGSLWGVKSSLIGFASTKISLQTMPELAVNPQYNQSIFATEMQSVLKMRLFYLLWGSLNLFYRIFKVKGGLKIWARFLSEQYKLWRNKKNKKRAAYG